MTKKLTLKVKGMHCKSCVSLIKSSVKNLSGIVNVAVDIDSQKAEVMYDGNKTKENEIMEKIKKAGDYTVELWDETEEIEEDVSVQDKEVASSAQQNNGKTGSSGVSSGKNFLTVAFLVSVFLNVIFLSNATSRDVLKNLFANLSQSGGATQNNQEQIVKNNNKPLANYQQPPEPVPTSFTVTKDDHIRGDFDAPITLVEFSDFECPFCERHYRTLQQLFSKYPREIRLVYKHFPLGFHQNAQKAAEASECADEQGKFWEYHDKLFEKQSEGYSTAKFKEWAEDLGLNSEKFNNCLNSDKYTQKIKDDYQKGIEKGVNGTPATFVNGQLVSGAVSYEVFKQVIDNLLNQ